MSEISSRKSEAERLGLRCKSKVANRKSESLTGTHGLDARGPPHCEYKNYGKYNKYRQYDESQ